MSVEITIDRNFGPLDQLELVTADDMRELGLQAREIIIRRTRQGIGADGQAFEALSPEYAKRKREELGHANADLTVSGNMLNHITITEVEVTPERARVRLGWEQ
jgi:hypothetical protein